MPCRVRRIYFGECIFDVESEVYEPAEDSFLLAENFNPAAAEAVLDVGTGCGILAVLGAKKGAAVTAIDLNPFALHCAKANAKLNDVSGRICFIQGDLLSAFKHGVMFDLILFNAPYLPSESSEQETWIGRSWAGGVGGRAVIDRFISNVSAYLKPKGTVLLMQSTLTGIDETIHSFVMQNLNAKIIADLKLPFFETLTLIEARH